MNRLLRGCFVTTLFLCCAGSQAAVFERDWLSPGDGLLTYDDVHRREWLDLSQSRLDQFPEPRLENALAQLAPGGMFDGFTFAKRKDVVNLALSAGIDTTTLNPFGNNNAGAVTDLTNLLGVTYQFSPPRIGFRSIGFIDGNQFGRESAAIFQLNANPNTGDATLAGLYVGDDDLVSLGSTGSMLYRIVPEPSAILMMLPLINVLIASRHPHR
jgi:hypothetical protein